jgi:hypothetical protein
MIVYMEKCLAQVDVLSVGMWLQVMCLLLEERGLGSCVEASVAGYPEVRYEASLLGEEVWLMCMCRLSRRN